MAGGDARSRVSHAWPRGALGGLLVAATVLPAVAQEPAPAPAQIALVVVGQAAEEPELGARVESLFGPATEVELGVRSRLTAAEILEPAPGDAVHVWIAVEPSGRARIYVATRPGETARPRYLLREVTLEAGLDEVGAETVAQIAHSSVMALWSRESETSREALAVELAREETGEVAASALPSAPREESAAPATSRPIDPERSRAPVAPVEARPRRSVWAPRFGGRGGAYRSGDEGWSFAPGLFAGLAWRERWGLRVMGEHSMPHEVDTPLARIELMAGGLEARATALLAETGPLGLRVDAGGGLQIVRWRGAAAPRTVGAGEYHTGRETRGHGLLALVLELATGPVRVGLGAELRVPTTRTRYLVAVDGSAETIAEAGVAPGLALELAGPAPRRERPGARR